MNMNINLEKKENQKQNLEDEIKDQAKILEIESATLKENEDNVNNEFENLQNELNSVQDKYIRLGAEFENFKKRSERELQNNLKYANEAILSEMLPILDHLEQAIILGKNESKCNNDSSVLLGVQMVLKKFKDVMKKIGIEEFSAIGKIFNPALHEAITQQINDDVKEGTVLEEYQKGYTLNGRLVRAARVVVSKKS